ncbi:class I SAM-dependent methyltransferase [Saccharothrix stipae]
MGDAADIARAQNLNRYGGGHVVSSYLGTPYHRVRSALAVEALAGRLAGGDAARRPVVVDIGAGSGEACAALDARGCTAVAADFDHDALVASPESVHAVRLDATADLPLRSGSVDGVLLGELVEHLFEPQALLRECHRVLRPGGVLVVTTPNLATAQDRLRFLSGRSPRQVDTYHEYLRLHIRPFTRGALVGALRKEGFTVVGLASNHVLWRTARRTLSSRTLARAFPGLGGSLIATAIR